MKNVSFSCGQNARMIAIVGPVGAGKVRPNIHEIPVMPACTHFLHIQYIVVYCCCGCSFVMASWLDIDHLQKVYSTHMQLVRGLLFVFLQSTLLHCLLGELKPLKGGVDIVGSLGYAAQDPWVFSGTLRENILFGQEFDGDWFQQVVDACCLNEDFKQLPYGEATTVGERGVTLSGGQKARVTLARWVH